MSSASSTFVGRADDDSVARVDIVETGTEGDADASLFAEAASGLLDDADHEEAAAVLEPGIIAAVLVYENTWAAPFAATLRRNGAQLVAPGGASRHK